MIDEAYAFFERRIVAFETRRRGRRAAAGIAETPESIRDLDDFTDRLDGADVASFDLFDTLILRRGLAPEAIDRKVAGFARAIAGARAGEAVFSARVWLSERRKAAMKREERGDEPALVDAYAEALEGAGADPAAAEALIAFEAAVEAKGIVAAPGAAALLKALRGRGLKIVALSDMYFRRAEIETILAGAGLPDRFDDIFVSAEHGWTKNGGRLFPIVAERLGVAPERIVHIGDRIDSDRDRPTEAGWRAVHFIDRKGVAETAAMRIAESHVPSPALRRSRIAAALDVADGRALASPERIVDQIVGPACGLLALKALTRARAIGATRLYHLTRDATVVGEIAEDARRARPHLSHDRLEIRELAVSRALGTRLQVRRAEDLHRLPQFVSYLNGGGGYDAAAIARAFDLEDDAFTEEVRAASGGTLRRLLGDAAHAAPLVAALDKGRAVVEAYLEAAGVLDPAPFVAVDIGYSGTFAVQLGELFFDEPKPGRRAEFHFLATNHFIRGNLRRLHPAIRLAPGVALDHRRRSERWATKGFAWLEPFLIDPDRGRLEGYDGAKPRFAPSPFGEEERARRRELRGAIRERAARFVDDFHAAPGDLEEVAALIQQRTERLAGRPRGAEVAAIRALAHQTGQTALAAQDPTRRVNPLKLLGEIEALKREDFWVAGSLRRSGLGFVNRIMADRPTPDRRADPRMMWD
ncbi:MAG: HAD family hydrolase [Pseudomonadota bacterium]